jgi:hypothetical protein
MLQYNIMNSIQASSFVSKIMYEDVRMDRHDAPVKNSLYDFLQAVLL